MKLKKAASIFNVFMGLSMIGMWILFYVSNQIPELETRPIEISLHIAAEIVTAVLLIISGTGLIFNKLWGFNVYLFSMGMLFYTLIMSPGYFLAKGEMGFVIMFGAFIILTLYFTVAMILNECGSKVSRL